MSEENKLQEYSQKFQKALLAIKKLKEEVNNLKESQADPIAVIGMAMRFPGQVEDSDSYWKLLSEGIDASSEVPKSRWNHDSLYHPEKGERGKINTTRGSFIENAELFDNQYFGLSPQEALYMDPQHRLLLETSYEALHNAGQNIQQLKDSNTAVFMGFSDGSGYAMKHLFTGNPADIDTYSLTGYMLTCAAGRISYLLGLQGENVALNTGCSASLTALHLACQSLRTRQSDMALSGGVSIMSSPEIFTALASINGLSPDGRCKTFDASADGFGRGEGTGIIVLKRLSDAIIDGDNILALIKGTASNQDGASNGFTAPSGKAQEKVILKALKNAGLTPAEVDYVEAHGTGTPLGDPIEIEALQNTYGKFHTKKNPLYVGSVKTNIGHLEGAAGIAGVIKAILSLQNKQIPKSLHFKDPNPHIDWNNINVEVPTELLNWKKEEGKRRAAVSAFGVSGTNVHIILEEAPENLTIVEESAICTKSLYALPLSAKSNGALKAYAKKLAAYIIEAEKEGIALADICANAALNSPQYPFRRVVSGSSYQELHDALSDYANGISEAVDTETFDPQLAFVFPGQGSQWLGMGRELFETEPVFRQTINACENAFKQYVDWSLTEELNKNEQSSRLQEIDIIQPTLFAIEVALARLWQAWGIQPKAVVGHSMGEAASAYIAGALSLDDAAAVICLRSKFMKKVSGKGSMLLTELNVEDAQTAIKGLEAQVAIAVSNSPASTVLSGDTDVILQLKEKFDKEDIFCRLVKVDVASHSPHMDSIKKELVEALKHLQPKTTEIDFYSTVHKKVIKGEELTPAYWGDNLRQVVNFTQTTRQMLEDGLTTFVEMSPHPVLSMPLEQIISQTGTEAYVVPSLTKNDSEFKNFIQNWGQLFEKGYETDWKLLYPELNRKLVLPTYAWQKKRFWLETPQYTNKITPILSKSLTRHQAEVEEIKWPLASFEETRNALKPYLQKTVASITGYSKDELTESKRFSSLGLDSMMAMRIRNKLVKEMPVEFSVKMFWKHASVEALAQFLAELMHSNQNIIQAKEAQQEWIIVPEPRPDAEFRLFCFHDAGGNPSLFKDWHKLLNKNIELNLIQLPGRGSRIDEKPVTDMQALIEGLIPVINKKADKPFAFFGHSMGGILLFEVTRELRSHNGPIPKQLFISAAPNFKVLKKREAEFQLSDLELINRFPGLDDQNYEDKEFQQSLMLTLRADLELLYKHHYKAEKPLNIPIYAIGGLEDERVSAEGLFGWKNETSVHFEQIMRPGSHRYIDKDREFVVNYIQEAILTIPQEMSRNNGK